MNAGIVILEDGTPCIAFDAALPFEVSHVEFSEETHQVALMYAIPGGRVRDGYVLAFPLDPPFTALLRERKEVGVAHIKDNNIIDLRLCLVKFIEE